MGYTLINGYELTDEEIERRAAEYEDGSWSGSLLDIHPGRQDEPAEKLDTITVKFPHSMVEAMDRMGGNRSDFIRRAVASWLL